MDRDARAAGLLARFVAGQFFLALEFANAFFSHAGYMIFLAMDAVG